VYSGKRSRCFLYYNANRGKRSLYKKRNYDTCESWIDSSKRGTNYGIEINGKSLEAFGTEGLVVSLVHVKEPENIENTVLRVSDKHSTIAKTIPVNFSKFVSAIKVRLDSIVEIYYSNSKDKSII
jgi:hypothetical protein